MEGAPHGRAAPVRRARIESGSSAPWSGEYIWPATGDRVYEYACHEANYSFRGILGGGGGGGRILEADACAADEQAGRRD